jgi:anti-anti-sigma factor
MPLNVTSRVENEIAILDLEGTLTLGPTLQRLRDNAKAVLSEGNISGVIVQVSRVTATDSAGLGELTVVYTFAAKRGARVVLAGASQALKTMLEVTHLDGLLPTAPDTPSARKLLGTVGNNQR